MVKILFDLQISSYASYGSPLITSDSNFIFTRNIMAELCNRGIECRLLLGENWNIAPEDYPKNCTFGLIKYRGTEEDRYFVDYGVDREISRFKPDILWTNDPCRVGAYRSIFDGKIVAYNHWIDNHFDRKAPLQKTYFFRQLEAYQKADLCLFNSEFGRKLFQDAVVGVIHPWSAHAVVNPPLDTALIRSIVNKPIKSTKLTLLFNHRLSSAPQYADNVKALEDLMDQLDEKIGIPEYDVLVSNPSGKSHPILGRQNVYNIYSPNYKTYLERASAAWIQLTLFTYQGQWSMALAEAQALGMTCLFNVHSGYKEMVSAYQDKIHSWNTKTLAALVSLYSKGTWEERHHRDRAEYFLQKYSPKKIVEDQLMPALETLL